MKGFGGVVSFLVDGGLRDASRFVDACKLATIAPSLGAVETLIEQPALMSYFELTTEERAAIGTAVGAIIGAIAGGGKGAAIGAILGAGAGAGSIYVEDRNDLDLDRGSELVIRAGAPYNTPR